MALSPAAVYQLARGAGFSSSEATIMTAIAGAESGWNPNAVGDLGLTDATWGPSIGLWQIRSLRADEGTGRARDASRLKDPAFNAAAARTVYAQQGYAAWSVFSNGRYQSYLTQATSASTSGGTGGTKLTWPGHPDRYDQADIASLQAAEQASGQRWTYLQGGYSTRVKASGTSHAGGGVVDIKPTDGNWTRASMALIANGWIPFPRIDATWRGNEHIHAVRVGSPTRSKAAAGQEAAARAGGDGLTAKGTYAYPTATFTSWDGSATATPAMSLNPGDWGADAMSALWDQVKPALFTILFAAGGASLVILGLGITALPALNPSPQK